MALASTLSYARSFTSNEIITSSTTETEVLSTQGSFGNVVTLTLSGENTTVSFDFETVPQYAIKINNYSTIKLENGASIDMNSSNTSYGNIQINGISTLLIESTAGTIYTDKIAVSSAGGVLTINKENAIQPCSANEPYTYLTLPNSGTINMNASQAFNMDIRNGVVPTFKFANGAVLSIMSWNSSGASESMKLVDYVDNSIFLSDGDGAYVYRYEGNLLTITQGKSVKQVYILDADGSAYEGLELQATDGGFFLTSISAAVPEPAEWAVIFGTIALGLAVYRKRK